MAQTEIRSRVNPAHVAASTLAWVLAVILAAGFTVFGGIKLLDRPGMVQEFAQIGYGQWLRYFTGILEVLLAMALGLAWLRRPRK